MNNEDSKTLLALLGIPVFIALILIAFIPLGLFNAWVVQKMYIWFVLPLGAPNLNIWHIWGLSLIFTHYLTSSPSSNKKAGKAIATSLLSTLLMLLIGFILKSHI